MTIRLIDFKGELPHRDPLYLPQTHAQAAADLRLDDGTLSPIRNRALIDTFSSTTRTAVFHDGAWRTWDKRVHAVPGPTASDRLYITGDGWPKMEVDGTTYQLAIRSPLNPPLADAVLAADPEADTYRTYVFAITYVTEFGEESGPSQLTSRVNWSQGPIQFSNFPAVPSNRGIIAVRLYQSETSITGQTDLFFKAEIPIEQLDNPYEVNIFADEIAEPIPVKHFTTPPPLLSGLTAMPNGIMAGFVGKRLLFCEPYQPHAWPADYELVVDYDIVGLAAFGSSLAVLTTATPYVAQGTHPDSMALSKIEQKMPCLSAGGIVDLGYAAIYPTTTGLVQISESGAEVITDQILTREQWEKVRPDTIRAASSDRRYVFTFDGTLPGGSEKTAILDLTGEQPFLIRSTDNPALITTRDDDGRLYMMDDDGRFYAWDDAAATSRRTFRWRSKLFELPFHDCYTVLEVRAQAGAAVTTRIYGDGALIHETTITNEPERLPPVRARRWEIEVAGNNKVTSVTMAAGLADLGAV